MKVLISTLMLLMFSCTPEQEAAQFGITIKPLAGDNVQATTNEDTPLLIKYEVEKSEDSVELSVKMVDKPKNGSLSECELIDKTNWQCIYTPKKDYSGKDSLKFKTKDGDFFSDETSTLEITILPVPDSPVAVASMAERLPENSVHRFQLNPGSDVDSDILDYQIVTSPLNGQLQGCGESESGNGLTCEYIPNQDYVGEDSFSYKIIDDEGLESEINTEVNLVILNYPEIGADKTIEILGTEISKSFSINPAVDSDNSLDEISYVITKMPQFGSLGSCFMDAGDLNCEYQKASNYQGMDELEYKAIDSDGLESEIGKITFKVDVKEPPIIGANQTESTIEGNPITFNVSSATDVDSTADQLTYIINSAPTNGMLSNCFQLLAKLACTYTPAANFYGSDSFTYKVMDERNQLSANLATVTINVEKLDRKPVIGGDVSVTVLQGNSIIVQVPKATDNDSNDNEIKYNVVTQPKNGTLSSCFQGYGSISCLYTPSRFFYGDDSFTYNAVDITGLKTDQDGTISVTVNRRQAPVVSDFAVTVDQYKSVTFNINPAVDADSTAANIKYEVVTDPKNGLLANCFGSYGVVSCSYTPNQSFYGDDSFTYKAIDEYNVESITPGTVTITVNRVNLPPTLGIAQNLTTNQGQNLTFDFSEASDTESTPDKLSYYLIKTPSNGQLVNCFQGPGNRSCTYVPNANFYGVDKFRYSVKDEEDLSAIGYQEVTIEVNKNEYPPVPGDDLNIELAQDSSLTITLPEASDLNEVSSNLSYRVDILPGMGSLNKQLLQPNDLRKITYTTVGDIYGVDTFEYSVVDSTTLSSTNRAKVNITILDRPNPGEFLNLSTLQNAPLTFNVPMATDKDSAAGDLKYDIVKGVQNGVLSDCFVIDGSRACTYTPVAGFIGEDTFTYKITDEKGIESLQEGQVKIQVTPDLLAGFEEFVQGKESELKGVDFTWVVDNSGSMGNEQANLANNFEKLIDKFVVEGKPIYPFNMFITTSDKKIETSYFPLLSSTQAELDFEKFKTDFKSAINVGIYGSGYEKIFESTEDILVKHPDLYSDDRLHVIVTLSDEKEQSLTKSPQEWVEVFQNTKQKPEHVKVFNIVNTYEDDKERSSYKHRFKDVAELSGGKRYDINGDFSAILSDLSVTISTLLDSYTLRADRVIIDSSVKVYVGSTLIMPSEYSFGSGILKFNQAPPEGSQIRVEYDYYMKY